MDRPAADRHGGAVSRHAKTHLRWLLGFGAVGILATAAINVAVNPWRVLPQATEIKSLDPARDIDAEIRTGKAGLASRGPWETLVIGSSRPSMGIDPSLPAFEGHNGVNLGMSGCDIYESAALLEHALKTQSPRQVVLFIDGGDLFRVGKVPIENDFEISPMAKGDPVERSLRYVFSQRAVDASFATLITAAKHKQPVYTVRGLQQKKPRNDYFRLLEKSYLPWAVEIVKTQRRKTGVQADKVALIRKALATCLSRGIAIVVAIPPNHLSIAQVFEEALAPDPYLLEERRELAALVAEANAAHPGHLARLIDLNIPSVLTTEPFPAADSTQVMANWLDPIHFTPSAGDRMMALLLAQPQAEAEIGIRADTITPDEYLAEVSRRFEAARPLLPEVRAAARQELEKVTAKQAAR